MAPFYFCGLHSNLIKIERDTKSSFERDIGYCWTLSYDQLMLQTAGPTPGGEEAALNDTVTAGIDPPGDLSCKKVDSCP